MKERLRRGEGGRRGVEEGRGGREEGEGGRGERGGREKGRRGRGGRRGREEGEGGRKKEGREEVVGCNVQLAEGIMLISIISLIVIFTHAPVLSNLIYTKHAQ